MDAIEDEKVTKNFLSPLLKEIIDGLLLYQDQKTKLFYHVVDMKDELGNFIEVCGSSLISFAILKGIRLDALDQQYKQIGLDIFQGTFQKYRIENHPKNIGPLLMAYAEVKKIQINQFK